MTSDFYFPNQFPISIIMDLKELKRILQNGEGKIVIVEEEKPVMVVFSWQDFAKGFQEAANQHEEFSENGAEELPSSPEESGGLTIDDLPL